MSHLEHVKLTLGAQKHALVSVGVSARVDQDPPQRLQGTIRGLLTTAFILDQSDTRKGSVAVVYATTNRRDK